MQSVPIFQKDALAVIDGLTPYLQFQSTLAFLKNPPKTYALPGVDLIDGLQQVRTNVINKKYKGEHAFQLDLWDLLNSAHDAHLRWVGDTLQSALTFVVPYELVSVSGDGQASPSIYLLGKPTSAFAAVPLITVMIRGYPASPRSEQATLYSITCQKYQWTGCSLGAGTILSRQQTARSRCSIQ